MTGIEFLVIGTLIIAISGAGMGATALGIIIGERNHRVAVVDEMRDERAVLRDALKQISETHNAFVVTQKSIDERLHDLDLKVNIMYQGIKK